MEEEVYIPFTGIRTEEVEDSGVIWVTDTYIVEDVLISTNTYRKEI